MGQSDAFVGPDAVTVRPTMALQPVDAVKHGFVGPAQHAANPAHEKTSQRVAFEASSEGSAKVSNPRQGKQRPSRPAR